MTDTAYDVAQRALLAEARRAYEEIKALRKDAESAVVTLRSLMGTR
jgi:hypothetical protein